jgi:6-phosphogluconolactonase (cycloisomerase 2 family)
MAKPCTIVVICVCLALLAGCGSGNQANPMADARTNTETSNSGTSNSGSSSNGSGSNATPVTVSPGAARVPVGTTQQFTLSGLSTSITSGSWAVNGTAGGDQLYGTISSTGLYTAPAVFPPAAWFTISFNSEPNAPLASSRITVGAAAAKQFAYVSSASDDAIQGFTVDAQTGTLQPASTFLVGAGTGPTSLALSPNGRYLYSLNRGTNDISIFQIDPATGALNSAGTVPVPNGPYAMVFSPKGDYAYVSCDTASTVAAYAVNLSTGALIPLSGASYVAGGGRIQSLGISSDGKFLYAANRDTNKIIGLAVNRGDGSLSALAGSPFSTGAGLTSIAVGGYVVHTANDDGIEIYHLDTSGLPTLWATLATGGTAPVLFQNAGLLAGTNSASGEAFAIYGWDGWGNRESARTLPAAGTSPVAGGSIYYSTAFDSEYRLYVLNRKADASSANGSIGFYSIPELVYPISGSQPTSPLSLKATIPTALHNPTGFVITP